MRAAVLHTPGETPELREHPDPGPASDRTVVRVTAAPLVPLDLLCASGTSYFGRPAVPYVPGVQGVGVVESGPGHAPGTRVWFSTTAGMAPGDGSLAERCAVPAEDAVPVAADVDDAALAALGLSAVAAWMSLTWRGGLQRGEHVLVLGAGGAVGQSAVGAARLLGAGRVVAAARSAAARERALAAGADAVVALDADVETLAERFAEAAGGRLDLVVDPVFGAAATAAARALSAGGRLVNLGGASGDTAEFSSAVLRGKAAAVLGYTNNALTPAQRAEAVGSIAREAAAGRLAVAHERVPLADVAGAWRRQATGDPGVRLVLTP
ncbi:zinc-binding alcohol dehydrogenase family protein [Blastococcus sp. MG754426]|uniref:quinone oxidoreductase family protein n=1 Tax=unclassified Blastococcus TaxID=2619396 RepID=UPI001EF0B8B5|nr:MULTISPECIES: zinc-binding alcohol dehydrogenase family protein [unclassified Blastococcus]MCF6507398.1 zinc-binding alcohol dehydrogenase family protein [Blastococcus sp. MG754426]MCF6512054.1 zinc-binding alcohol dehydrogenase family protein [Blastococcus sp. MG754427]MCF6734905.1 zinc-binding alcohol dehydrogenase family protein [Blastococcus sp. KM273129]